MNKKILIDLIGILLIALLVVVGYKLSPLLLPQFDLTLSPAADCDLQHQACAVSLPAGGMVELTTSVHPIPMVKPFQVVVTVQGFSPSRVDVDFAGVDMNMGLNRPQLQDVGNGRFVAEASLPVCITGAMDWQATLLVKSGKQRIAIPFRFSGKPVNHE